MIELQITAQGGIQMLHSDAVDLEQFGEIEVLRASNVEYCDGFWPRGINQRGWYVQSARTLCILAQGFRTRTEALEWETSYFSPSGKGWAELTK